ncbi:MAG: hypothetical protein JNJ46_01125 [Myxococcales bacterium]|nr:hypothetical protein [Myxococcales bacterium]
MKLRRVQALSIAAMASLCVDADPAQAHGGIPAPQQILWRGDSMLIPTPYWGLFVGTPGGPWHWICDEAINTYQQHTFAVGGDGTLYATDRAGMQVSRDGGCSWDNISGPLAGQYVLSVKAAPGASQVWALSSGDAGGSSLWISDDTGRSWQLRHEQKDTWPSGLLISADAQILAAGVTTAAAPRQTQLLVSRNAGATFSVENVSHFVGGQPLSQLSPLWIDPQPPHDIWAAGRVDTVTTLLQISPGSPVKEHLRLAVSIFDMLRDPQTGQIVVATAAGLFARSGSGPFAQLSTLSTSRCLSERGGSLFACAWNFQPDLAAIVQLRSAASQRTRIFQYQDTQGPQSCPATTAVGKTCPMAWNVYAAQLGIELKKDPPPASGCAQAPGGSPSKQAGLLCSAALLGLAAYRRISRRRSQAIRT